MKKAVLLAIVLVLIPLVLATEGGCPAGGCLGHNPEAICIAYFYGAECHNCALTTPFIESLEEKYGDKTAITKYEIYHDVKNYQLYNSLCDIQNLPMEERGVPLVAVSDRYFMGVSQIKKSLEPKIQEMLKTGERACPLDGEMECRMGDDNVQDDINPFIQNLKSGITTPLVLGAGLIDGVNPCAFAVLIFLLAFLMEVSSSKKRMIRAGAAYVIAVYVTYFLAGLGLLTVIQFSGASAIIVKAAAVVAILAGLVNVKDYFWYGKGFSLRIPESRKKTIGGLVRKANLPAALMLGFIVSMFELPCTGGVYLVILAMLSATVTKAKAIYYLLIYNVMFVLPLIVIIVAVIKGMKAEHIENWRKARKNVMKLALGLLLLALGAAMLLGWI